MLGCHQIQKAGLLGWLTGLAVLAMPAHADTVTNGITAVNPPGATQGVSGLVVTFTMATNRTPPLPPTAVAPTSVSIGAISGTSISRPNVSNVIATFTIPGGEPPGLKTCEIWFAPPPMPTGLPSTCYNKIDGFNVDPAANQPVVTITNVKTFVSNLITSITIGGTNDTNVVGTMTWTNTLAGTSGTFAASTVWSFSAPLVPGENRITVSGTNSTGSAGSDSVIIVRLPGDPTLDYVVVDTGQFNCYDATGNVISAPSPGQPFYGQDAQLDGPQPNYIDMEDGTVWDVNTGLMWQKSPDLQNRVAWTTAVAAASATNIAGYTDWRMPTIKELYSLIQFYGLTGTTSNNSIPYLDTNYFDHVYGETNLGYRIIDVQFWSGTKYVGQTQLASSPADTVFGVNFADGRIKGYPELDPNPTGGTYKLFVRYVRGNPNYGVNDFEDNGDGTVSDNNTGLMWSQDDLGGTQKWEQALAFVEDLNATNFLGYNDWRLPNVKELHSLLDYTKAPAATNAAALGPAINTNFFHLTTNESWFISGTTHAEGAVPPYGNYASYVCVGRAWGYVENPPGSGITNYWDVHGAGAQRSDPKDGDPADYAGGLGPQGDEIRIYNWVRVVRDFTPASLGPDIDVFGGGFSVTNGDTSPALADSTDFARRYIATIPLSHTFVITNSGPATLSCAAIDLINTNSDAFSISDISIPSDVSAGGAVTFTVNFQPFSTITHTATVSITSNDPDEDPYTFKVQGVGVTLTSSIFFVDADSPAAPAFQDGASWTSAFESLQDVMALVSTQQVWVAEGVYYVDESAAGYSSTQSNDVDATFYPQVSSIYGGFSGTETNLDARDPVAHRTILSGDVDHETMPDVTTNDIVTIDPDVNIKGTNAGTLVYGPFAEMCLLDGLTITGGKGYEAPILGGVTMRRCTVQGNVGSSAGCYYQEGERATFVECDILNNVGGFVGAISGGGISNLIIVSCRIQGNRANWNSSLSVGGIILSQKDAYLANCLISGNVGKDAGGIFVEYNPGGTNLARLDHCTIAGNFALATNSVGAGGLAAETNTTVLLYNSIIWSNSALSNANAVGIDEYQGSLVEGANPGGNNLDGTNPANEPQFTSVLPATTNGTSAGDFHLIGSSPAINAGSGTNEVADFGDLDEDGNTSENLPWDLDGGNRVNGVVDMGAYEAAGATTYFVAPGGNHTFPYTNWVMAATTVQAAVDAAISGDLVLVSNGVYNTGGRVAGSSLLTNRVVIDKPITVRSVNGASVTTISGNPTSGDAAVRCVWMTNGATLAGFTLTNGATRNSGDLVTERSAGGLYGQSTLSTVSNCVIAGNQASYGAGGAGQCTLNNCLIAGNTALSGGGGVANAALYNCTVVSNRATTLFAIGGGILDSTGWNCIVYFNTSDISSNHGSFASTSLLSYSCSGPLPAGAGNIASNPLFVSAGAGNFRLQLASPARDAGNNADAPGATDLDGDDRIRDGTVDMGAYEVHAPVIVITNLDTTVSNVSSITIGGTSSNITGLLGWSNMVGDSATFAVTNPFQSYIPELYPGTNVITVFGTSAQGYTASDSVTIVLDPHLYDGGATPIHYVDLEGGNQWPYTNWSMAATTIQAAVDAAMEGDTVLVTNGVYNTGGRVYTGHVLTNRVLLTRQVTLRSVNGPDVTVIEGKGPIGNAAVRGLFVWSNATVSGFTITNGFTATSGGFDRAGAGIFLYNGSNVISNCTVVANVANDYGGGIYAHSVSYLDVLDCTIAENSCVAYGGGLVSYAAGSIRNTTFSHNSAGGGGGGADLEGGQTVSNCVFVGNVASNFEGGGIYFTGGGVIENCNIASNVCGDYGGGVCFEGTMPTMRWCTVTGNEAKNYGGGLEFLDDAVVIGCLIAGNTAPDAGGVNIESGESLSKFINCTIAGNSATDSGGGIQVGFDSIVHLTNTIVYGNTAATGSDYVTNTGGLAVFGYSCTTPDPGGAGNITNDPQFADAAGGDYRLTLGSPAIDAGTNLAELVGTHDLDGTDRIKNGTVDMGAFEFVADPAIAIASPASSIGLTNQFSITLDGTSANLLGEITWTNVATGGKGTLAATPSWSTPGIALVVGANDLRVSGSNETGSASASVTVTVVSVGLPIVFVDADTPAAPYAQDGVTWASAFADVQDAFDLVTTQAVWIAEGTYSNAPTYTLDRGGVTVLDGFTNGMASASERDASAYPSILDGEGVRRVLTITASNIVLDGLTIRNGYTTNSSSGAGLLYQASHDLGDLTLRDCTIEECTGTGLSPGVDGLGIALRPSVSGASPVHSAILLTNCTIRNNGMPTHGSADGAGIYAESFGRLTIANCTITNNGDGGGQSQFYGGGLYVGGVTNVQVLDTLFDGNNADSKYGDLGYGGGAFLVNAGANGTHATFSRCVFRDNWMGGDSLGTGSGLALNGASCSATLENCLFLHNGVGSESTGRGGGIFARNGASLSVLNCDFVSNRVTLASSNASAGGAAIHVHNADASVWNSIFHGNTAGYGENTLAIRSGGSITLFSCWLDSTSTPDYVSTAVLVQPGTIVGTDPSFVDIGAGNYNLAPSSPCIDAGEAVVVADDYDRVPRPLDGDFNGSALWDMGAYEHVNPSADSDGDGLADTNELYGTGTNPTETDTDGDSVGDFNEYIAGTEGTNASSYLYLGVSSIGTNAVHMYWPSVDGRGYYLDGTTNLFTGPWISLTQEDGTAPTNTLIVPGTNSAFHYRLRVQIGTFD